MTQDAISGTVRTRVSVRFLDLSLGGALGVVKTKLEPGAIHDIALELGDASLTLRARVQRCEHSPAVSGYVVAVEFLALAPDQEKLLRNYLAKLDPKAAL